MSEYKSIIDYERRNIENAESRTDALAQRHADYLAMLENILKSEVAEGLKHIRVYKLAIQCSEPIPEETLEFLFNAFSEIERIQISSVKHKPQAQIKQLKLVGGSGPRPLLDTDESRLGQRRAVHFFTLRSEGMPIDEASIETADAYNVDKRQIGRDRENYPEAKNLVQGRRAFERVVNKRKCKDK